MNIKSFFNTTVFKKDLTRFLPLWGIYLIVGVLLTVSGIAGDMYFSAAKTFGNSLIWLSVAMCIYALLVAQLLFGELFQSKMCNAIHALPVRREGLFLSHFAAGMLMAMGPNLVFALIGMLAMGRLWFVALLWWLALALVYFIFFSIAVFCMQCAGNRFAAAAIYALVNFAALLVMWYFEIFYFPMLYGLKMTDSIRGIFYLFSPVVKMANNNEWLLIQHSTLCKANHYSSYNGQLFTCLYRFAGFGEIWKYLLIVAVVGLMFAVVSFVLYRRRHLESAGDFVSFKPMGTVFTLLASVCVGGLFYFIAAESLIGLFIGLVVGFFVCRMLLERTIKVFSKKSWLYLTGLCLFMGLTLILTALDVTGVTRRIPDTEDVESVTIADEYLSDWQLEELSAEQGDEQIVLTGADPYYQYGKDGMMTLRDKHQIQDIREVHKLLIEEGDARENGYRNYTTITIHYKLKNGTTLTRYYYTELDSEAMQRLQAYITTSQFILGFDSPEAMVKFLHYAYYYGVNHPDGLSIEDPVWLEKLANALFADVEAGLIDPSHSQYDGELNLEFEYEDGRYGSHYIVLDYQARNTLTCLREYEAWAKENNKTLQ